MKFSVFSLCVFLFERTRAGDLLPFCAAQQEIVILRLTLLEIPYVVYVRVSYRVKVPNCHTSHGLCTSGLAGYSLANVQFISFERFHSNLLGTVYGCSACVKTAHYRMIA